MTRLTTLLIAFCMGSFGATAQITVTQSDFGTVGSSVFLARDTMPAPGTTAGSSGASQTWNFTSLAFDELDTITYSNPTTTPNGSVFPAATVSIEAPFEVIYFGITNLPLETAPDINYYSIDANSMILEGYSAGVFGVGDIPIKFSPPITQFEFPMDYLNTWADTAALDTTFEDTFSGIADSLRAIRHAYSNVIVDGWGTLTTPNGTYDVLRQFRTEITVDTVLTLFPFVGWTLFQTQVDTLYTYHWIAAGEDLPVMEALADAQGNLLRVNYKVGDQVLAMMGNTSDANCNASCDGSATVNAFFGPAPLTYLWDDPSGQTTATATGLCAGSYSVTVTDSGGATAIASTTIAQPGAINVTSTSTEESWQGNDGQISLTTSGGSPGYTYLWSNGATTAGINNLVGGTYTVTVTDQNGCTDTMSILLDSNVGIGDVGAAQHIQLFPVPSSGTLFLKQSKQVVTQAEVFDILGNNVLTVPTRSASTTIDLSSLKNGVYFLRMQADHDTITRRVVIQH